MTDIPATEMNAKSFQVLRMIWIAMLASLLIYVFVCHMLTDELQGAVKPDVPMTIIRAMVGSLTVIALIVARLLRIRAYIGRSNDPGPKPISNVQPPDSSMAFGKYAVALILSLALSELIAFFGLVLIFLGDNIQTFYTFLAVSAAAIVFYRPKKEELEMWSLAM